MYQTCCNSVTRLVTASSCEQFVANMFQQFRTNSANTAGRQLVIKLRQNFFAYQTRDVVIDRDFLYQISSARWAMQVMGVFVETIQTSTDFRITN